MLMIGLLTSYTDLREKKIYNQHLMIGYGLGFLALAYAVIVWHEDIVVHLINVLVAALIGFLMYRWDLWRGGDAKLFTLYAFLMPTPTNHLLPFANSVAYLFASSFIAGMMILTPVFLKDIIVNYRNLKADLLSLPKRKALFESMMQMTIYSWILLPLFNILKIVNPVIIFTILYIIFNHSYSFKKKVPQHYIFGYFKRIFFRLCVAVLLGVLLRCWLSPQSLTLLSIIRYILMITLSCLCSVILKTTFDYFKDYQDRVPFAPLLLIGCLLSYTPFLKDVIHVMSLRNLLFSP